MALTRSLLAGRSRFRLLQVLSIVCLLAQTLLADGGVVQFRSESGPFLITLFSNPSPLRSGLADLSVLVESTEDRRPVLDAKVTIELKHNGGPKIIEEASHERATDKLLYAALPDIPAEGTWHVAVFVVRQGQRRRVEGTIEVLPALPRALAYWPYLAVVPVAILLFGFQQYLKNKRIA